jgi:WD40 repeat protein
VALRDRVYVYNFRDLTLRDKIYTTDNPHGLLTISTTATTTTAATATTTTTTTTSTSSPLQDMVLACPSVTEGHVRVELYGWRKTVLIPAHESALRALALTPDGTRLATASIKGTVVRVFSILSTGPSQLLQEFRRGIDRVQMTCLAWSWDHRHVACCSDKGTAHVFQMKESLPAERSNMTKNTNKDVPSQGKKKPSNQPKQESSNSSWYKGLRLFSSDLKHSISQVRGIPRPIACSFVPNLPNTLAVVGWDIDGNGVLLFGDYSQEDAIRTGYHVIAKSIIDPTPCIADEGTARRKRLLSRTNAEPVTPLRKDNTTETSTQPIIQIGDRMELLEHQKQEIMFGGGEEEEEDDDGFLNIMGLEYRTQEKSITNIGNGNDEDENDDDDDDDDNFQDTPQE